jgi:AcrR family transcriptional regulator
MEAVAEEAGVTKPTVYAHFSSKEELFDAALHAAFARMKDDALPVVGSEEEAAELLFAHATSHLQKLIEQPMLGLARAAASEMRRRPDWGQELAASFPEDSLQGWLASMSKSGALQVKSPKLAAELFWALVKGPFFYPLLLGLREPPDARERNRVLKEAVRVFLEAHRP